MLSQGRFPGHMAAAKLHLVYLIGCSNLSCLLTQTPSSKNENASLAQKMIGHKILFSSHVSSAVMCFVKTAARMIWYCYTGSVWTQHIKCSSVGDSLISSQNPLVRAALAIWRSQKVNLFLMSSGFWSNPLTRKSFILWEMPHLCPGRQRSLALSSLPPP